VGWMVKKAGVAKREVGGKFEAYERLLTHRQGRMPEVSRLRRQSAKAQMDAAEEEYAAAEAALEELAASGEEDRAREDSLYEQMEKSEAVIKDAMLQMYQADKEARHNSTELKRVMGKRALAAGAGLPGPATPL
jgi:hypothetical protein